MKTTYSILVTGATGFLGKRLLPLLVKKYGNKNILCLVWNKGIQKEKEGKELLETLEVKTLSADLVTGEGLDKLLLSPKLVFHLAANTETLDPNHTCNNIGTKNLIDALSDIGPKTHIIHISTLVIFAGRVDCSKTLTENSKPFPTNEYTRTKLEGEKYMIDQCKKRKFKLTVIRPNTIYGDNMRDNSLLDVMKRLVQKDSILARINWPGKSSLIYVNDMARLIMFLATKSPKPGIPEIYNADPEQISLSAIAKNLYEVKGRKYKEIKVPFFVWKIFIYGRRFIFPLERLLPSNTYNWLWRFSIIVDDVIYCDQTKLKKALPQWKPHTFKEVSQLL